MIVYFLLIILIGILGAVIFPITFLPDVSLDPGIATAIATVGQYLWTIWTVIPLTVITLLAILVIVVGVETHIFSYKLIKWVYKKIPGIN